jgi:hypothetical protein
MAETQCNLLKNGGGISDAGNMYYNTNASAISLPSGTWEKVASISMTGKPRGRYLLVAELAKSIQEKINYARIGWNGSDSQVFAGGNVPYLTGNIVTVADVTDSISSIDLWYYGGAVEAPMNYIALKAFLLKPIN